MKGDTKVNKVSIVELASGERVGLCAVEIVSVPHLSILQNVFINICIMGLKSASKRYKMMPILNQVRRPPLENV